MGICQAPYCSAYSWDAAASKGFNGWGAAASEGSNGFRFAGAQKVYALKAATSQVCRI